MTDPPAATRRGALLAFADKLSRQPGPAFAQMAGLLRAEADRYPEVDAGPQPMDDDTRRAHALHCAAVLHAAQGGAVPPGGVVSDAAEFEPYLRGDQ